MSWNRILSGLLAVSYIVFAFFVDGAKGAFILALFAILPLACIWFSEAMGGYIGPVWRGSITDSSPGVLVCVAGWLLLLLPGVVGLIYALNHPKT
jgi:hypothetical protein